MQLIAPALPLAPQAVPRRSACTYPSVVAPLDKVRHLQSSNTSPASDLPQRPRPHHIPELLQPPVRQLPSLRIPTREHERPARQARLAIAIVIVAVATATAGRTHATPHTARRLLSVPSDLEISHRDEQFAVLLLAARAAHQVQPHARPTVATRPTCPPLPARQAVWPTRLLPCRPPALPHKLDALPDAPWP